MNDTGFGVMGHVKGNRVIVHDTFRFLWVLGMSGSMVIAD